MITFRACRLCKEILDNHQLRSTNDLNHELLELYNELQHHINQGRVKGDEYRNLVDTLYKGEEDFTLREGEVLRVKLLKIAEKIDSLSKMMK